jgi:hypothetical protein
MRGIQKNGSKFSSRKLKRRSLQYWKIQKKKRKQIAWTLLVYVKNWNPWREG